MCSSLVLALQQACVPGAREAACGNLLNNGGMRSDLIQLK